MRLMVIVKATLESEASGPPDPAMMDAMDRAFRHVPRPVRDTLDAELHLPGPDQTGERREV
jgi:hypothetical protein